MRKMHGLVILSGLSLILVACGDPSTTPSETLEDLGYNPNGLPIVEKIVEYDIISPKNALATNYNDMDIFTKMFDDTNVKINWTNLSEESFATTKQLIIQDTRNLPDAMYHAGFSDRDIIQYSAAGTIISFDEYLDNMPNFKNILEKRPDIRSVISAPDGKIYALPRVEEMGLLQHPNILFINKNWVNLLSSQNLILLNGQPIRVSIEGGNLEEVSTQENIQLKPLLLKVNDQIVDGFTLDVYEAILRAMKTNASLLTQANLIPLTFRFGGWQGNQSDLYAAFGVPENIDHLTVVNDQVVFTAALESYRNATNFYAGWIQDGLIERDVLTQGDFDLLAKGKGTHPRLGSFYWWEKETVIKPEWQSQYVALPPLIGPNGQQNVGVSNNQEISKGNFVVFSKATHPEVLLTWIDRFYDPVISAQINYGPIGIVYEEKLNAEGLLVQKPIPEGMTADELRLKHAPMGVIYLSDEQWQNTLVMEYRARLRLELLDVYIKPYVFEDVKQYPNVSFNLSEINTINRFGNDIYSYIYQSTTQWLLNGKITNAEWSAYVSKLNQMKLNDMLGAYQTAYERYG
jgi:putative aldouronate transport system substrate-binding protein